MAEYNKPLPIPSAESLPYWDGLRERKLMMPRCDDCGHSWFPPSRLYPNCNASKFTWTESSGRGKVFSFVVFHRVYHPGFTGEVPYVVALCGHGDIGMLDALRARQDEIVTISVHHEAAAGFIADAYYRVALEVMERG